MVLRFEKYIFINFLCLYYNNGGIIGYGLCKQSCWPHPIYATQIFIQLSVQNTVPYCTDKHDERNKKTDLNKDSNRWNCKNTFQLIKCPWCYTLSFA